MTKMNVRVKYLSLSPYIYIRAYPVRMVILRENGEACLALDLCFDDVS